MHLSWARDEDTALAVAREKWRSNCLPTSLAWELETPEQFEAATRHVPPRRSPATCSSPPTPAGWPSACTTTSSSASRSLYLHPVGEDDEFIDVFGEQVLPGLGSP